MTKIDLVELSVKEYESVFAWCIKMFGPITNGRWTLQSLRYLIIEQDKAATLFWLRWS